MKILVIIIQKFIRYIQLIVRKKIKNNKIKIKIKKKKEKIKLNKN